MSQQWIDQLSQWVENNNDQWLGQHGGITISGVTSDISAYLKSYVSSYSDMAAGYNLMYTSDISASLHGFTTSDLGGDVHGLATSDLGGDIHSWHANDLFSYIGTHSPANIQAILNIIEIREIEASITGVWFKDQLDLLAGVYKIWSRGYKNLQALLHGWATRDLQAYINAVYYLDLSASIRGSFLKNLLASISPIPPEDLFGFIHGFDTRDIPALLNGGYGPGDIQAYINGVGSINLQALIVSFTGIETPFDLGAILYGSYASDLFAYIGGVTPADLNALIDGIGSSNDLKAIIIPSTILMKRAMLVPLLEYKNLGALVNFMCFESTYRDLSAGLYAFQKLDLDAFIIGWYGSTTDNIKDLGGYVNCEAYVVKDRIPVKYVPEISKYSRLKLNFASRDVYTVLDKFNISFGSFYVSNLKAAITGALTSVNLKASLTALWDWNYSELPNYIKPKSHEVFLNVERFEDQWKRFVEVMFDRDGNEPFKYFYVGGSQKVYKIDRSRHWTIWADGYTKVENNLIEKATTRRKFIFRMSDYNTIDEAIRSLIEKAAYPSYSDMGAFIDSVDTFSRRDLGAGINTVVKHTWVKHLTARIKGWDKVMWDLPAFIQPNLYKSTADMSAVLYTDAVNSVYFWFNESDAGYIPPTYSGVDFIWMI